MAIGIGKGDHLGIWARNVPDWLTFMFATAKIGVVLVTVNPVYKSHELAYVIKQSDMKALCIIDTFRDVDYVEIVRDLVPEAATQERGQPALARVPGAEVAHLHGAGEASRHLHRSRAARCWARHSDDAELRERGRFARRRRRHQHAVHVGHDRLSQGRHAHAPQHPEQRLLHRRAAEVHPGGPRLPAGPALSLLRLRARRAGASSRTAPRWSWSRASTRCSCSPPCRRRGAPRSTACRRCSSRSSRSPMFAMFDLTSLRTGIMAGSPVSDRDDAAGDRRDARLRDHHLLRPDRGVAGHHADDDRRHRSSASARRSAPQARRGRGAGRRPRDRRGLPAGRPGELLLPRLQRHEGLLQRCPRPPPRRSTPTAGCTPATSARWTTTATTGSPAASRT